MYKKEYYLKHKEKIAEYNKKWREKNKEKWNKINRENSKHNTIIRKQKIKELKNVGVLNARKVVLNKDIPLIDGNRLEEYKNYIRGENDEFKKGN